MSLHTSCLFSYYPPAVETGYSISSEPHRRRANVHSHNALLLLFSPFFFYCVGLSTILRWTFVAHRMIRHITFFCCYSIPFVFLFLFHSCHSLNEYKGESCQIRRIITGLYCIPLMIAIHTHFHYYYCYEKPLVMRSNERRFHWRQRKRAVWIILIRIYTMALACWGLWPNSCERVDTMLWSCCMHQRDVMEIWPEASMVLCLIYSHRLIRNAHKA